MENFESAKQLFLQGLAALQRKELQEAETCFRRSLEIVPGRLSTLVNLAAALLAQKKFSALKQIAHEIIDVDETSAEGWQILGIVHADERCFQEALANINKAISLNPRDAESYYNRAKVLHMIRRYDEALESYGHALAIRPDYAEAHNNRGSAYRELGRLAEALRDYERAIALSPDTAEAHFNQGVVLLDRKRYLEAVASFDRALEVRPGYPFLRGMRLHTLMHICVWNSFRAALAQLEAGIDQGEALCAPFAMLTISQSAHLQRRAAERWAEEKLPRVDAFLQMPRAPGHGKIRIGYFSADFREHPVSWLTAELIERHDRARFEVYGFSLGPNDGSGMRNRLVEAFDVFIDVRALSDSNIMHRSRELGIDIAVDLAGYTEGSRAGIFAERAAPVQVGYIGYLGTMGAPFMDYLIADETLIPESDRQHYTEKIAYLPWYQANDTKRRIADRTFSREELGLPAQGFVFCCFNNNFKITPETFDGWMRILKRVEGSVLMLYAENPHVVMNLKSEARLRGVEEARLIFGEFLPRPEYLARYRTAELFLDTLPYNAGTTASDALWAGLPVLTLLGTTFAGRMAASVLRSAGLPELIAATQQEYEDLAVILATDKHRLAAIRQKMAHNRSTAPLFDIASFTRNLEALYTQMHARRQSGLASEHLERISE